MRAAVNIGGHPIHPLLVPVPIGLWAFALVADVMYLWRDTTPWIWVAYYCLGAGCLGAVAAAAVGLVDLLGVKEKESTRAGALHAAVNVVALVIFAVDFYLRTGGGSKMIGSNSKVPFVLSIIGVCCLLVAGWLGGELVFRYGLGVNGRPDGRADDSSLG